MQIQKPEFEQKTLLVSTSSIKNFMIFLALLVFSNLSFGQITVDENNNVGVGIIYPLAKLDINGILKIRIIDNDDTASKILVAVGTHGEVKYRELSSINIADNDSDPENELQIATKKYLSNNEVVYELSGTESYIHVWEDQTLSLGQKTDTHQKLVISKADFAGYQEISADIRDADHNLTNEIQTIDNASLMGSDLHLSLLNDAEDDVIVDLSSLTDDNDWTVDANNNIYHDDGNVAIGTVVDPSSFYKLEILGKMELNDGNGNIKIGNTTDPSASTGSGNLSLGYQTLNANTDGESNIAFGEKALFNNTTKSDNIAIGKKSLLNNGLGNPSPAQSKRNIGIGSHTLENNTIGYENIAIGFNGMLKNSNGSSNTALGTLTLMENESGYFNVAIGHSALKANTEADGNTSVGVSSLYYNKTGNYNTAIGFHAGPSFGSTTYSNTGAFGNIAIPGGSNEIVIGNGGITEIGGNEGWTTYSDGRFKRDVLENIPGLDFITRLRPISYRWTLFDLDQFIGVPEEIMNDSLHIAARQTKEQIRYTGFIAQEVDSIANFIGYDFSGVHAPQNDHDPYGLEYSAFVVPLVKAVQEQQTTINYLHQEINNLNTIIADILARLEILEGH